jgi:hypothetical protein
MWISEFTHLGLIGLVADQQRDARFCPHVRWQQCNQENNKQRLTTYAVQVCLI